MNEPALPPLARASSPDGVGDDLSTGGSAVEDTDTPDSQVRGHAARDPFSYVIPIASPRPYADPEFVGYLESLAQRAELIVVDGSSADVFAENERHWGAHCRHVAPLDHTVVGKVGGVTTGVSLASHARVVVADDDVRFGPELETLVRRLDAADVVLPQNYFDPLPWHAVWDSGRSLLNRVTGGDWPGTLALRRDTFSAAGGYADVMFENYELVKTLEAVGGKAEVALDLFVRRIPPTTAHFLSQRVRQAYDELARPARLLMFLPVVPATLLLILLRRFLALCKAAILAASALVAAAEAGRRRAGARQFFPLRCSLAAPVWAAERSFCVWAALFARARGGVLYRGQRVRRPALRPDERSARLVSCRRVNGRDGSADGSHVTLSGTVG